VAVAGLAMDRCQEKKALLFEKRSKNFCSMADALNQPQALN